MSEKALRQWIEQQKVKARAVGPLGSSEFPFQRGQMWILNDLEKWLDSAGS